MCFVTIVLGCSGYFLLTSSNLLTSKLHLTFIIAASPCGARRTTLRWPNEARQDHPALCFVPGCSGHSLLPFRNIVPSNCIAFGNFNHHLSHKGIIEFTFVVCDNSQTFIAAIDRSPSHSRRSTSRHYSPAAASEARPKNLGRSKLLLHSPNQPDRKPPPPSCLLLFFDLGFVLSGKV